MMSMFCKMKMAAAVKALLCKNSTNFENLDGRYCEKRTAASINPQKKKMIEGKK